MSDDIKQEQTGQHGLCSLLHTTAPSKDAILEITPSKAKTTKGQFAEFRKTIKKLEWELQRERSKHGETKKELKNTKLSWEESLEFIGELERKHFAELEKVESRSRDFLMSFLKEGLTATQKEMLDFLMKEEGATNE